MASDARVDDPVPAMLSSIGKICNWLYELTSVISSYNVVIDGPDQQKWLKGAVCRDGNR